MGLDLLRGDGFEKGGGDGVWRLDWTEWVGVEFLVMCE